MKSASPTGLFPASEAIWAQESTVDAKLRWLIARDPAVSGTPVSMHLDHRPVTPSDAIPNMFASGGERFYATDPGCCVHLMDGFVSRAWRLTASAAEDCLRLRFAFLGGALYSAANAMLHEKASTCTFIIQPSGSSLTGVFRRDTAYKFCAINMSRRFLGETLGLDATDLPPALFSNWQRDQTVIGQFPLDRATLALASRMFTLEGSDNWRRVQVKALALDTVRQALQSWERQPVGTRAAIRLGANDRRALVALRNHADAVAAEGILLKDAAAMTGLNRNKLQLGFRQMFGLSLQQYCLDQRMQKACEMLRDPANSIGSIAIALGFSEPTNFTAAFRKHFGVPPSRFRGHGTSGDT
ncbi:helix-turn-helix domain-containing protein [Sphingomonas sp. Leaf357]|uniref:helix-turn-helix domain-containing protein n=1 Tax=Sphingomonas sp. Leaf357 TaxID=1736350 RepID=UPI001F3248AF|nr:AraC family transcriptional regulator [Sphingomonas sp. Leaf357]